MGFRIRMGAMVLALMGLAAMLSPVFAGQQEANEGGLMAVADAESELTTDEVERYLAAMGDLRAFAKRVEAEAEQFEGEIDAERAQVLQAEQAEILDEHGFNQETWMAAHERIFQAAMADAMRREMSADDIEQEFAEQQVRIREHEDLPEEQREMMLEQLDQQMEVVRELQANPNIEVVAPYYDEFQELFGDGM